MSATTTTITAFVRSPAWQMKFEVDAPTPPPEPREALPVEGRPSFLPL